MKVALALSVLSPLLLAATPATRPATRPAAATTQSEADQLAQLKRIEQADFWRRNNVPPAPQQQPRAVADLFQFAVEKEQLVAKPKSGKIDRCRMTISDLNGDAVVAVGGEGDTPEGASSISFTHSDFSRPDEIYHQVQVLVTAISLQLVRDQQTRDGTQINVQLIQRYDEDDSEKLCTLYVQ